MRYRTNRRRFLLSSAWAGIGIWTAGARIGRARSPNERLNLGIIGAAARGAANMAGLRSENFVAFCDVDERHLAVAQKFPGSRKYVDWRAMIDQPDIDAVVVSTTDHTHAMISIRAMRAGKHVYCEKPVAISVEEARRVREAYLQSKVATQHGTQVHAAASFRRSAELIQQGAIGPVREAHVWCTRTGGGWDRPQGDAPIPESLHWDLWLGPAPHRPYNPAYIPGCGKWNKYWDFGAGTLGDMGSHLIDFPYTALKLTLPATIAAEGSPRNDETYPAWLKARWEHPADGARPAVQVFWYDGIQRPPAPAAVNVDDWHGILYVGQEKMLWVNYGGFALLPVDDPSTFQPPKPDVPPADSMQGHYDEWITACKTGSPTSCNFDYVGRLIEHNMLGIVAFRTGKPITWDAENMQAVGCPEADRYLRRTYREGWALEA